MFSPVWTARKLLDEYVDIWQKDEEPKTEPKKCAHVYECQGWRGIFSSWCCVFTFSQTRVCGLLLPSFLPEEYVLNLCEWIMCLTAVINQSLLLDYRMIPCFQMKGGILWKDTAGGRSRTELIVFLSKQSYKGTWHHSSVENCWSGCYASSYVPDFMMKNICEDTMWMCRAIHPASGLFI